jgi:hypothetical protein
MCALVLSCVMAAHVAAQGTAARASQPSAAGEQTPPMTGVVRSATRTTLVIRADDGHYELYVLDANTTRPEKLPEGASVAVTSKTTAPDQPPTAVTVRLTAPLPEPPPAGQKPSSPPPPELAEPIPQSVRSLEEDIKRQTKRFHIGARAGMALDPELVMFGAQAQFGPFFTNDVAVVPSLELGFGELTTLVDINIDIQYRLPVTQQTGKWGLFVGGGPGFNFSKQSFTEPGAPEEDRFNFSDLTFDSGLNVVIGLQSRSGLFLELRSTAYSTPHIRFSIGYNF